MTSPYYQDDQVTVYHGEALRVLADLPTHSVDAVICDPPYSSGGALSSQRKASTASKYVSSDTKSVAPDFVGDVRDQRAYQYWATLWISECVRALKPSGFFIAFTDWRQYAATADAIQAGGITWRGTFTWLKPAHRTRPMKGRFSQPCEYALWGTNGDRPIDMRGDDPSVFGWFEAAAPYGDARVHQTQKPVDLMRHLMGPLKPGSVILDPFAGSGTTGVAAIHEGHRAILCEMVPEYAQVCVERVQAARLASEPVGDQQTLDLGEAS